MKTLLLVLFASYSAFSQIPRSGDKADLKLDKDRFYSTEILPGSPYKVVKIPEKASTPEDKDNRLFNYQMPVKKVNSTGYAMPFKEVISFDEMNTDFYFKQRQITIDDTKK